MIRMTLSAVAAAIGASAPVGAEATLVTSVEFDSRKVHPGALFVALPGEHADGHDFAAAAAAAGAVAVLGTRTVAELPALVVGTDATSTRTDAAAPTDEATAVLHALSLLAHHVATTLTDSGLSIVGVTGSAGKTSTKDLIAAVLARAGTVVAPPESFNNELGHPYTVLRADEQTDFLVLELSARGIGHIAALTRIAPPRIGAVLNVGSAHLGEFGSRDAIAVAKGELVEALPAASAGGIAILNADDPRVIGMAPRTAAAIVTTGVRNPADISARGVTLDAAARASFELATPEGSAPVQLAVVGAHQVPNALAAAAVGRAAGIGVTEIADALSAAGPVSHWRMAVTDLPDGVTVVNDAYNANPESMGAALEALGRIGAGRRRWAVLGEMAELGEAAPEAHRQVGEAAQRSGARVVAIGDGARALAAGAAGERAASGGPEPLWLPDIDAAVDTLRRDIRPGDVVLVKASRAVGLERLALRLVETLPSVLAGREPGGDGTSRSVR
jgi:UDP-N-acetylmuramoyl-tripeptide--D-alanyl-D-alanine ligase